MKGKTTCHRLLRILLICTMLLGLMATAAFATDETCSGGSCGHVAAIGNAHYDTFAEAVTAASSNDIDTEIVLLKDVTMDNTYFGAAVGQTLTLDLNGKTLTRTWQDWDGDQLTTKSVIYNQGTLTIKDSSDNNTGKIQGYSDISGATSWNQELRGIAISNASGAALTFEGGTITRGDVNSFGYYTVYNKGTFNMSGGVITNGSCSSAMVCNVEGGSKFVMTGGELKQLGFQTLKNENGSTVEISGGTLTSDDRTLQNYGTATINGGTFNGDIQIPSSGSLNIINGTINGELYGREGSTGTINITGGTVNSTIQVLGSDNAIKGQYETLAAALAAVQEGQTIQLPAETISEGDLLLPATLKNVTIKGADGKTTILKDMSLRSADGTELCYEGVTFSDIVFDNTNIVIVGWRSGAESYKNWTIQNCEFKNIVRTSANEAAVHFNVDGSKALNGFTFTNNVIDGVSGGSNSGIYATLTGRILIKNNIINNVAFRPYIAMFNCNDGIEDSLLVEDNTFSGSAVGRAQSSVTTAGDDTVTLTVKNNIFKDITDAQQICYWNFNTEHTTSDLSGNYYDIDLSEHPNRIYFNSEASNSQDLIDYGVYPLYTALTADDKIDRSSEMAMPPAVVQLGNTDYYTLVAAIAAAQSGDSITLLKNIAENVVISSGASITIDLNGFTLTNDGDHTIINYGNLTIVDNSNDEAGTVDNTTQKKAALVNYGTAILNGGTFTRSSEQVNSNSYYVIFNYQGDLTINAASVINTSTYSTAVENKTDEDDKPAKLTINAGATISNNFTAVKNSYVSELVINGGTISGNNGNKALQTYGFTTINNGTFNGDVEATDWTADDTYFPVLTINDGTINGNVRANALKYDGQVGTDAKVVIAGGTINGTVAKTYQENTIVEQAPDFANAEISISGGTFSNNIPADFCVDGFRVIGNENDGYQVVKKQKPTLATSDSAYDITSDNTENGSITVSPKSAKKGSTVTITITPDNGYELDGLTVLDNEGKEVKVTENNGKYTFEMPASKVTIKPSFKKITTSNPFTDVNADDYFFDAVMWAIENGITSGTSATTFSPNESCTRAQIVTFLWRAAGSPEPKNAAAFSDVAADSYYAKAVAWAVENGITSGTGDNKFSPNETCTRGQAVTFLSRALKGIASGDSNFLDVDSDSYYAAAIAWAVENGITNGTSDTTFSPDEDCTRGQIVTLLFRAMAK